MNEETLKIPDKKFDFFMKRVKELGFEVSEKRKSRINVKRWSGNALNSLKKNLNGLWSGVR